MFCDLPLLALGCSPETSATHENVHPLVAGNGSFWSLVAVA